MLIGYTAHDLRAGKPAETRGYLAELKAGLASPAIRTGRYYQCDAEGVTS
jgi:hypothetical protein